MRDELKPCPFCGSANVSLSQGETGDGQPWPYVECEECAATAMPEHWNTRQAQAQGSEGVVTVAMLADAFGCFWNAAIGSDPVRNDPTAAATVAGIATGMAAIETRLREYTANVGSGGSDNGAHAQAGEGSNG